MLKGNTFSSKVQRYYKAGFGILKSFLRAAVLPAVFIAGIGTSVQAANYKWVDEQGVTHFTNMLESIPEYAMDKVEVLFIEGGSSAALSPGALSAEELEEVIIPYREFQEKMLVDVLISGFQEEFIFDSTAENTVVTPSIERKMELEKIPESETVLQTPDGEIETYMVRIDRLRAGSLDLRDIRAAVRDFTVEGSRVTGILGTDVLGNYTFTVNPKTKTIHLKPTL